MPPLIPIVIPAYDPDERLVFLLKRLCKNKLFPVILVDDGSHSECQIFFKQAKEILKDNVIILKHENNCGKGRALKTAFSYVLKKYPTAIGVVTADSDGQHTPACIRKIYTALVKYTDQLILGVRNFQGSNVPWKSAFGNKLTSKILQFISGASIDDTQTGLRGIPVSLMPKLLLIPENRFEFETKMLLIGLKETTICQVPIRTVYDSVDNHQTHFRPIVDSLKIYRVLGMQFFKYGLAAITSCLLDLFLFVLFCDIFQKYSEIWYISLATVGARFLSSVYNYLVNYHVTFSNKKNIRKSSILYTLLAITQMIVSAFFVTIGYRIFGFISKLLIKIIVDTILFFVSYYIQRRYVFHQN